MELTKDYVCFKSRRTPEMFIYGRGPTSKLLYSPDGKVFYELARKDPNGLETHYAVKFEDPHHDAQGELIRNENTLIWMDKIFKLVSTPAEVNFVPLPHIWKPKFLFKSSDGYIFVSADKYYHGFYKLYTGAPECLKEVPISTIVPYGENGAIYFNTEMGTLYSPAPYIKSDMPTWNNETVEKIKIDNYNIVESGSVATITKK